MKETTKKQKKNNGCINCEHYKEWEGFMALTGESICNSGLTIKTGKETSYKHGIIEVGNAYHPPRENKNLTCKGFTPIDWKAKYEKAKGNKPDSDIYVKRDDYEKSLNKVNILEEKNKTIFAWLIITSILAAGMTIAFILKGWL